MAQSLPNGSNRPTMTRILLLIPLIGLVSSDVDDKKAVERAVLDYVEGVYEMKPDLIRRSVHPELQKIGYWREDKKSPYKPGKMTFEQLVALSKKWNEGGKKAGPDAIKKVEVLDLLDQTAVAKLTAKWGIDYMHLAKYEGKWKIVHVMWQVHPN